MLLFNQIVLLAAGAWLVLSGFILNTKNIKSAIYFKVIPFILGALVLYIDAKMWGWI